MIIEVGQGRMLAGMEQTARSVRWSVSVCALAIVPALSIVVPARAQSGARRTPADERQVEQTQREEGEAILALADAALAGRTVPSDFRVRWQNDFVKAQRGTFVPFTISFAAPAEVSDRALLYVRVESRSISARASRTFAYETIFPVRINPGQGQRVTFTRGFAVPAGRYRAVLALRELAGGGASDHPRKAAVLLQDLSVPDFWTGELATSTIMLSRDASMARAAANGAPLEKSGTFVNSRPAPRPRH